MLYQHAHDSGRLLDRTAEWEIPFPTLREAFSKHESNERLRDSLMRLKNVKVNIQYVEDGEPRVIITELFDFFDIPVKNITRRPTLRYGIARKVVPVLESSSKWGRIQAEIVCTMTSKYAMALCELVQLRRNMERMFETFTVERFRDLPGVAPGKYTRVDNLMSKVIEPAVLQVNCLSEMNVKVEPRRRHSRAPVHAFDVGWWPKQGDEFREAVAERNRSKVGRMARLKGKVEKVEVALQLPQLAELRATTDAEVAAKLERMRAEEREAGE